MTLILQVVATALTMIGAATLYWGTSPSLLSLGNTVMVVGAVIAASGIVLFGLSAVLGQLGILADKLDDLRWALESGRAAAPAQDHAASAVSDEDSAEPSPLWREGLPEKPAAEAPRIEPVVAPAPAPAAPVPPPVEPKPAETKPAEPFPPFRPLPPSRESFGLKPLAVGAAGLAAGAAAGLAASRPAAAAPAPASTPPDDAASDKLAADIGALLGRTGEPAAEKPAESEPVEAEKPLEEAVEDLKSEVKAAEADLVEDEPPPADEENDEAAAVVAEAVAVSETNPSASDDHLESLEKLLLGDAPARAPAEVDTEDFMARLRETISRPVTPPQPGSEPQPEPAGAEPAAEKPAPAPEPEPDEEEPLFSIEAELERALKASLEEPAAPPPAAREPRFVPPPPAAAPAEAAPAEERMSSLARDFPELNDILAPKKPVEERPAPTAPQAASPTPTPGAGPSASPANALMDDLKSIFEPASPPPARQEPSFSPPPPAPPVPSAPTASAAPILREGVIAGIPFRLYGDGSIEADLESGTTRFASLKDFRAHVGG